MFTMFTNDQTSMTNLIFMNLTKIHDTDKHYDQNSRHPQTLTLPQKNMLVQSAWTGPPAPARKLALAGTPAQPRFAPLQEKKHQARILGGPRT